MIPCTEFIPAYNAAFKFIDKKAGEEGIAKYWNYVNDSRIADHLGAYIKEKGVLGCFEYWSEVLAQSGAAYKIVYDDLEDTLIIEMRYCPSMGALLDFEHIAPYENYCGHCVSHKRIVEKYGLLYETDLTNSGQASCTISIRKKD